MMQRWVSVAAFLAGLAFLYTLLTGRNDPAAESGEAPAERGYYLSDARLTELDQDGRPRMVVHAQSIEQQLDDQSVQLSDMTLDYAPQSAAVSPGPAARWKVTASRGRMPADRSSLILSGDVRVTGTETHGAATITTDQLSYDPKSNIVQTSHPVVVQYGSQRLQGRGMRVDLNAGTLKLESNINGSFTPP